MLHSPKMPVIRPARRAWRLLPVAAILLLAALLFMDRTVFAQADHTAGFTRYARVDRADGTYREMLADKATLDALQADMPLPERATILMESYYRPGEIGSIFAKRYEGGRWIYGSFRQGEPLPAFSPRPQCAGCHRAAGSSQETFTFRMLERFAQTGVLQQVRCNRSGRAPCDASVYAGE